MISPDEMSRRVEEIGSRLQVIEDRIHAAGGHLGDGGVQVLAVTKGHSAEAVIAGILVGLRLFGESYAQEFSAKALALEQIALGASVDIQRVTWHFIGQLQRNKVRAVAPVAAVIQSVDRQSLVEELARRSPGHEIFLQVDLAQSSGAPSPGRGGVTLRDAPRLAEAARTAGLALTGVMGVAPVGDERVAAQAFRALRALADRLEVSECSMGMSDDLEVAVAEGTTMVRLGSALMGPRTVLRA